MNISVIIPVYKKTEMFLKNLSYNYPYLQNCFIIVVNDDPSASLKKELAQYPNLLLVENKKNLGFGMSVNKGVAHSHHKYIFLLNSDVRLVDDSYKKSLSHFQKDPKLFAVSFAQKEKNGDIVGKNKIYWKKGMMCHKKANDITPGLNGWAEGGACIINKKLFSALGGFDPLYSPFYWEDIDLSYRAWKHGFDILFDPAIQVEHHHESTIGAYFSKEKINTISYRNQFIFIWKNITDFYLLSAHVIYLIYYCVQSLFQGNFALLNGFWNAVNQLPGIISSKNMTTKLSIYRDKEILNHFL